MPSVPLLFFLRDTDRAVNCYKKWWNTTGLPLGMLWSGVFKSNVVLSNHMAFLLSQFPVLNTYGAKMHCTAEQINFNMRCFRPSAGTEPSLTFLQKSRSTEQCIGNLEGKTTASCFWHGWTGSHGSEFMFKNVASKVDDTATEFFIYYS